MKANEFELHFNGDYISNFTQKECLGLIVQQIFPHIKYMSKENIKLWLFESFNLIEESFEFYKNPGLKKSIHRHREKLRNEVSLSYLHMMIGNIVLYAEGLNMWTPTREMNKEFVKVGKSRKKNK